MHKLNSFKLRSAVRYLIALSAAANFLFPQDSKATSLDLSDWIVEDYVTVNSPGNWTVSGTGNDIVTQVVNADPTLFLSNGQIDVSVQQATGLHVITITARAAQSKPDDPPEPDDPSEPDPPPETDPVPPKPVLESEAEPEAEETEETGSAGPMGYPDSWGYGHKS